MVLASDDVEMPDTLGHAVGIEREELLAREAGDSVSQCFVVNLRECQLRLGAGSACCVCEPGAFFFFPLTVLKIL